jgi:hypothetical protein
MNQGPFVRFMRVTNLADLLKKKTGVWRIEAIQSSAVLGGIKWYPAWRRYCFYPLADTIFDANCLWDIADFCARMTKEQREIAKKRRVG